jgi:hypothetical protein
MCVSRTGCIKRRVQRRTANNKLEAVEMRGCCLRRGQIGIGLWQTCISIEKEHIIFLALNQWFSCVLPLVVGEPCKGLVRKV